MNPYGNPIHNMHRTPTYISWQNMKARAKKPGHPGHDPRWQQFEPFLMDMGTRPPGTDIGRFEHDSPYCEFNCFWQPSGENRSESANRRWSNARYVEGRANVGR